VAASIPPHQAEQGVLAVLAGTPPRQVAADIGLQPADLADAVEVYQAAGRAALQAQAAHDGWHQVRVQFTDWDTAEHVAATRLGPHLQQAQHTGALGGWWFIRKAPCWRLRCRPGPAAAAADMHTAVSVILDNLTATGMIDRWWQTIYEPELCAFGGPQAMDIAHTLFHADSLGILDYLRRWDPTAAGKHIIGRRELSVLLCTAMLRAAGQEWHEQGDVWHRVTQMRPLPSEISTYRLPNLSASLHRLMTVDIGPASTLFGTDGPLAFGAQWAEAFHTAGQGLGNAARDGTLRRGVRDILAHHVIFHWNRAGLPSRTQSILARAARDSVMNPPSHPSSARLPLTLRRADVGET
jgi:thiopeptide-type bacteriocin biosynthesis protein